MLSVAPHPLLDLGAFEATFPRPLGALPSPDWLVAGLRPDGGAALAPPDLPAADDAARAAVRELLRHGGYKPTGRGKPASEYLLRAAGDGSLGSINAAVDACNVVSLHTGLPISVVDLGRAAGPFAVRLGAAGERYAFNRAGQEIDLPGLLVLCDAAGPCANGVKDAQRTKTAEDTTRTLSLVWGTRALGDRAARAVAWYRALLARLGATTAPWPTTPA